MRWILTGVLLTFTAIYLGGLFFLLSMRLDVREVTFMTLARYTYHYADRPEVIRRVQLSLMAASIAAAGVGIALARPKGPALHGEAQFASRSQLRQARLFGSRGLILGRVWGRYVMLDGQQGVALSAPPRSGKGVGVVIPNLLNWPGSVVCVDIKHENWRITAGYRHACGQACFLFEPLNDEGRTARWNPFTYVSPEPARRINDLQRIASMFYPEIAGTDPFWVASARSLFLGIALYLFETPSLPKTIGEVLRQGMASDDEGFGAHWKRIISGRNSGRYPLSPECVRALSDVIDLAPVTASSIRKTFTSRLDLWMNPLLDRATAESDFDLRDLRRQPLSIYVAVNPDDLHRLRPVLSLFFEQAIGLQTRTLPEHDGTLKLPLAMILDECPALGYIPILAESIAYVPGYNVRILMVFQAPSQLRHVYGAENAATMLKSLGARIVFAPKDFEDAREISNELGNRTVKVRTHSRPRTVLGQGKGFWESGNVSTSEQSRPLLLPQELRELGADRCIIFYEGLRPILCKKIRYFRDRKLKARVLPPPTVALPKVLPAQTQTVQPLSPDAAQNETVGQPAGGCEPHAVEATFRDATSRDMDQLDSLTLDDIELDLSKLSLPEGQAMNTQELEAAVESFMAALHDA
jgi:type IV secretion system protein VirD4